MPSSRLAAVAVRLFGESPGLYGDLPGNIERLSKLQPESGVIMLDWSDLDARLGSRLTDPQISTILLMGPFDFWGSARPIVDKPVRGRPRSR